VDDQLVSGIERAVFGAVGRETVDGWLGRHLRARLGVDLSQVVFRSGRVAAVYGAALSDGGQVAVKVLRRPADLAYLAAAAACQRRLAAAGYPCPEPLDGPSVTEGLTAMIETVRTEGRPGNGHNPATRRAMAGALVEQVRLLRDAAVDDLLAGAPAWCHYQHGPWPTPHDPIFNFTSTPEAFGWLDELARQAASVLAHAGAPDAVAHVDWCCGNLRFRDGRVSASYDWDSLAAGPEPVLVGMSAGAFTSGGTAGADTPTPVEVAAFLQDYEQARSDPFSASEQQTAAAAATWVLTYNARCNASFLPAGGPPSGSPLHTLTALRNAYLDLRW
jgi:Phosphotransferase enzyme family